MHKKILIVEDDRVILKFLSLALETNLYEVVGTDSGLTAINIFMNQNPDLVLLDLGLPDLDGVQVLKELLAVKKVPIIIISARGREQDKIEALDLGACDFITKPFNIGEVLARIRVALRNISKEDIPHVFEYEGLYIDFDKYIVKVDEEEIHLTPIEFKMLRLFIENQGKVLTHAFIQNEIWGYHSTDDYQSLRVFMASIRKKIEKNGKHTFIKTEIGVGYRFIDE